MRFEYVVSIELPEEARRKLEKALKEAVKVARIPADVVFVHIVESHDVVREILNIKKPPVEYEEKPVKLFLDYDTLEPVLSIRKDAANLSFDDLVLEIARELTTYEAIVDPIHVDKWAIPEDRNVDPIDALLSTAMLLRTVDSILVERGLGDKLAIKFETQELSAFTSIAESPERPKVKALQALSWDLPLSLELGGRREIGERLFLEAAKRVILNRKFVDQYEDFRTYSRENFYFENVREYLELAFEDEDRENQENEEERK